MKLTTKLKSTLAKVALLSALLMSGIISMSHSTLNVYAQTTITHPRADVTEWKYKIEDGKLYKRLYNSTQCCWVGDWIYVCDI